MRNIFLDIKKNWNLYFLISSLIIISSDTFRFGTSGEPIYETIRYGFISICFLYLISKNKITSKQYLLLLGFLILFFISSFINGGGITGGPILLFISLTVAFATTRLIRISTFSKIFINIILLLSGYSIIIWMLVWSGILPPTITRNAADSPVLTSFGCVFFDLYLGNGLRNSCVFREPGVYMIFLNIAFIMEAFILNENVDRKKIAIYALAVFSTFSTAGFLIFGIIFLIYTLKSNSGVSKKRTIFPIILILGVCTVLSLTSLGDGVFGKLSAGEESKSFLGRVSSITIPLEILINNPLFGCGIERFENLYVDLAYSQYGIMINPQGMATNTLLNSSATFGIWYGLFILIGLYKLCQKMRISTIKKLIILLCLVLCLCNEVLTYSIFIYWFIFYGYKKKERAYE